MATYRANRDMRSSSRGLIRAGTRTRLDWLNADEIRALLMRGLITEEKSPDLSELAGWKTRATRLAGIDVVTIEDLLEADPEEVAEHMHVKEETVERWIDELRSWQDVPPPKRG